MFNADEIAKFAKANDWKIVDTANANLDFPNQILNDRFDSGEIKNKNIIYLKSTMLTIDEDRQLDTDTNGFAIIDHQKNTLIVYYRWGDF